MRYHLWTVLSSRAGPYGVLDSGAVTGAPDTALLRAFTRFGRLLQGVFPGLSPPPHTKPGALWAGHKTVLLPVIAVSY